MLDLTLDFLSDIIDSTISIAEYVFEKVIDWATNAWNWLTNFFSKVWKKVVNWFDEICAWAKNELSKFKNVVIFDQQNPITNQFIDPLVKIIDDPKHHMSREEFKNALMRYKDGSYVAMGTSEQLNIEEVTTFSAEEVIDNRDNRAMQKLMEEHDHILRIGQ